MIGRTFYRFLGVLTGLQKPETQVSEAERAILTKFASGRKCIVEIGVFEGFTTRVLADAADPDAIVYGVDPFFTGRLGICWGKQIARAHNWLHLARGKVRLVCVMSTEVADQVPRDVDFVFIDADHTLAGITADWGFWSKRVVSNGIIALHDVLPIEGRKRFGSHEHYDKVIRHESEFEIIAYQDSLVVLRRKLAPVHF